MSDFDWAFYTTTADQLASEYPVDMSSIKDGDFSAWAAEGLNLAKNDVYPGKYHRD